MPLQSPGTSNWRPAGFLGDSWRVLGVPWGASWGVPWLILYSFGPFLIKNGSQSYPKIDVEFVHFLGGRLERFRHPSILKNKPNQWSVCTDHSFDLFSFSLFFSLFCVENVTIVGGKMVKNRSKIQHGLKMAPKGHPRPPWGPFGALPSYART